MFCGSFGHFHRWRGGDAATSASSPQWGAAVKALLADPSPKRPLLAWGHDLVSAEAVRTLHAHGCHVLETWPGDSLPPGHSASESLRGGAAGNGVAVRHLAEASQHRQLDGRPTVLLISDVDCICHTGRATLRDLFKEAGEAKKKAGQKAATRRKTATGSARKGGTRGGGGGGGGGGRPGRPSDLSNAIEWTDDKKTPPAVPALRIVCTCSDYYAPSMRTAMHALVPKSAALQVSRTTARRTPWQAVDAVRERPATFVATAGLASGLVGAAKIARQEEADRLFREDGRILATLHAHAYDLDCLAEGPTQASTVVRAANVAEHFSVCDLLDSLTTRKRKLHEDDDVAEPEERPGNDPHIAALAMGLALKRPRRPQFLQGAYAMGPRPKVSRPSLDEVGGPLLRALTGRTTAP